MAEAAAVLAGFVLIATGVGGILWRRVILLRIFPVPLEVIGHDACVVTGWQVGRLTRLRFRVRGGPFEGCTGHDALEASHAVLPIGARLFGPFDPETITGDRAVSVLRAFGWFGLMGGVALTLGGASMSFETIQAILQNRSEL